MNFKKKNYNLKIFIRCSNKKNKEKLNKKIKLRKQINLISMKRFKNQKRNWRK